MNFVRVHLLHKFKKYKTLKKLVHIEETIKTIKKADADVIGINEVLGEWQRAILIEKLKQEGYTHFHFGQGHELTKKDGHVESLIATRIPSTAIFSPILKLPARHCFGGGLVGIHIQSHNIYVFELHLALSTKERRPFHIQQMNLVMKEVEKILQHSPSAKIIIMGDFNSSLSYLRFTFPQLASWHDTVFNTPTYSATNIMKWIYKRNLDHIFTIGTKAKNTAVIDGKSDHRLCVIYCNP